MTITCNKDALLSNNIKIYINNILHLSINRNLLCGVQSWIDVTNNISIYSIEFYFKDSTKMLCQYNEKEKWENIIKNIDNNLN
jgi:hypothetical protein